MPAPSLLGAAAVWLAALLALVAGRAAADSAAELLARGDAAWLRRAEGRQGLRARAEPIAEAVAAYTDALAAAPEDVAVRERLLRALYFQARFSTDEGAERREIYRQARDLADEGLSLLAAELGLAAPLDLHSPEETATALAARPEAAALLFWSAGHWGLWGETSGKLAAARQGVARQVRDRARLAILIDESYESGGGHRILGRLHTQAPRIPLVTGWVSRQAAVEHLEQALALDPAEPMNRLYLADALLRFAPQRRAEATAIIEALIAELPRPGFTLQDESTLADAQRLLAQARRGR